jgi:hypothetical protein
MAYGHYEDAARTLSRNEDRKRRQEQAKREDERRAKIGTALRGRRSL